MTVPFYYFHPYPNCLTETFHVLPKKKKTETFHVNFVCLNVNLQKAKTVQRPHHQPNLTVPIPHRIHD